MFYGIKQSLIALFALALIAPGVFAKTQPPSRDLVQWLAPYVGKVVGSRKHHDREARGKKLCSSVAIDNYRVMTNLHCLPKADSDCSDIQFYFRNSKNRTKKFNCTRIIAQSSSWDYLIVETDKNILNHIDKHAPQIAPIWETGPAFSISPWKKVKPCLAEDRVIRRFRAQRSKKGSSKDFIGFQNAALLTCEKRKHVFIPGDSGSPIFNFRGELMGLGWGKSPKSRHNAYSPIQFIRL